MLVTVTSCGELVVPACWLPKFNVLGESVARGMTPVPVNEALLFTVPETVSDAVCVPVDRGENVTVMVQPVVSANVAGQLLVWLKSRGTEMLAMLRGRSPMFA